MVADYLGTARGVRCTSDQVIIVAGIQQALDLTARIVLDPGDRVWIEDPCFFGVVTMFTALGAKVVPVPVDRFGLNVTEGVRRYRRAKLANVTPAIGFRWGPIPALQGQDCSESVVFACSFSKLLFPSLRLGYLVPPASLVDKFAAARYDMDRHSAIIDQAIMCDFITAGHFGRHIRHMWQIYAKRLDTLRASVDKRVGELMTIPGTEVGVQTVGWLRQDLDSDAITKALLAKNAEVLPISRLTISATTPPGLLLFGAVEEPEILRGVDCLASPLRDFIKHKPEMGIAV